MASKKAEALFKVTASQALWDRTNNAAREIISSEISQRDANSKRLRTLRLARDAEAAAALVNNQRPSGRERRRPAHKPHKPVITALANAMLKNGAP
ncbi:hypothetical protein ACFSYD_16770 [Paracoccus aerius]